MCQTPIFYDLVAWIWDFEALKDKTLGLITKIYLHEKIKMH